MKKFMFVLTILAATAANADDIRYNADGSYTVTEPTAQ
jgi:hypothetical protein